MWGSVRPAQHSQALQRFQLALTAPPLSEQQQTQMQACQVEACLRFADLGPRVCCQLGQQPLRHGNELYLRVHNLGQAVRVSDFCKQSDRTDGPDASHTVMLSTKQMG